MKFARTVCGDIQAEEMGFTYPHEHLYAVPPTCQKDRDLEVSDYEGSVAELKLFKSVGGQTLVEASTLDYGVAGSWHTGAGTCQSTAIQNV